MKYNYCKAVNRISSTMYRKSGQRIHRYVNMKYALPAGIILIFFVVIQSKYSSFGFGHGSFDDELKKSTVSLRKIGEDPVSQMVEQDNSSLIKVIQEQFIDPPSKFPYNLDKKLDSRGDDPSFWQAGEIYKLFKGKENGIFVECGAHDGEFLSNTLLLEKLFGWTGALIEANPISYENLKAKNRKSWTVKLCLSPYSYPKKLILKLQDKLSQLSKTRSEEVEGYAAVQCFPLYSVLLALNLTKVDYFSLDVEGSELDILKTIPWDKVDITAWSVEFNHIRQGKSALKRYMRNQGYEVYVDGARKNVQQNIDIIFVKNSFLRKIYKDRPTQVQIF